MELEFDVGSRFWEILAPSDPLSTLKRGSGWRVIGDLGVGLLIELG